MSNVWPLSATRDSDGALSIGGVDVRDAAATFGTPLFLLDEADIRSRARAYREAAQHVGASRVYYAAKAFLSTAVAQADTGVTVTSVAILTSVLRAVTIVQMEPRV